MERHEEAQALQMMLECRGWADILAPLIQQKLHNLTYATMGGRRTLAEAELRAMLGEASMAQWVLSWPRTRIEEIALEVEEELRVLQDQDQEGKRQEHLLRYGHHGPVLEDETPPGDE